MTIYRSVAKPRLIVPIMHSQAEINLLMEVVNKLKPTMFIELGNWCGGLTLALHQKFPNMEIYSFDLYNIAGNLYKLFNNNVTFIIQDVLKESPLIKRLLDSEDRKFLYCDNGNKVIEISLYAKYLHNKDGLGVHDYVGDTQRRIDKTMSSNNFLLCNYRDGVSNRFWTKGE